MRIKRIMELSEEEVRRAIAEYAVSRQGSVDQIEIANVHISLNGTEMIADVTIYDHQQDNSEKVPVTEQIDGAIRRYTYMNSIPQTNLETLRCDKCWNMVSKLTYWDGSMVCIECRIPQKQTGVIMVTQMSLKQRALAAYEAAQERKAHEEAEREAEDRRAHEQHLRALCQHYLSEPISELIPIWLPLVAAETIGQPVIPVCEIDGLLFTCRDISEDYPRLIIYGARYNGGDYIDEPIFSPKYLWQELKNRCILGEIRDGAIRYAEEDYDCEQ